jgi:hypothetical protein
MSLAESSRTAVRFAAPIAPKCEYNMIIFEFKEINFVNKGVTKYWTH